MTCIGNRFFFFSLPLGGLVPRRFQVTGVVERMDDRGTDGEERLKTGQ